jgi:molecular chaperone GrpE (heat shock protein)
MGLLDSIEKLINEHGSAAILKERIDLANDKYSALEDKNSIFQQKVEMLESENKTLQLNLEKAQIEIQNLKKITDKPYNSRIEEIKEKILALLATQDNFESNIAQSLGIGNQVAAFHLQELDNANFIYRSL